MSPSPFLSQRLPFRLLQRIAPTAQARIGRRPLRIPTYDAAAALAWLFWRPSWKNSVLRHFLGRRPGAFVDVGANTGQTLADFLSSESTQSYIGLEPNPQCVAFVDAIVGLNRLRDVTLLPVGAAAHRGLHAFYIGADCTTDQTASLRADLRPTVGRRTTWVNTLPLDEALEALTPAAISLVKIDVEGAELDVLAGAAGLLGRARPPILCEVLLADASANFPDYCARLENLADLLRQHGYRIHHLIKALPGQLPALNPITAFPQEVWTSERADDCDYLFTPDGFDLSGFTVDPSPSASASARPD